MEKLPEKNKQELERGYNQVLSTLEPFRTLADKLGDESAQSFTKALDRIVCDALIEHGLELETYKDLGTRVDLYRRTGYISRAITEAKTEAIQEEKAGNLEKALNHYELYGNLEFDIESQTNRLRHGYETYRGESNHFVKLARLAKQLGKKDKVKFYFEKAVIKPEVIHEYYAVEDPQVSSWDWKFHYTAELAESYIRLIDVAQELGLEEKVEELQGYAKKVYEKGFALIKSILKVTSDDYKKFNIAHTGLEEAEKSAYGKEHWAGYFSDCVITSALNLKKIEQGGLFIANAVKEGLEVAQKYRPDTIKQFEKMEESQRQEEGKPYKKIASLYQRLLTKLKH